MATINPHIEYLESAYVSDWNYFIGSAVWPLMLPISQLDGRCKIPLYKIFHKSWLCIARWYKDEYKHVRIWRCAWMHVKSTIGRISRKRGQYWGKKGTKLTAEEFRTPVPRLFQLTNRIFRLRYLGNHVATVVSETVSNLEKEVLQRSTSLLRTLIENIPKNRWS